MLPTIRALLFGVLFLVMLAAVAGCVHLLSAEQLEDGSAVMCFRVEPSPDAGADAAQGPGPTMRYVPGPRVELP
jgi:hypothetical protein